MEIAYEVFVGFWVKTIRMLINEDIAIIFFACLSICRKNYQTLIATMCMCKE